MSIEELLVTEVASENITDQEAMEIMLFTALNQATDDEIMQAASELRGDQSSIQGVENPLMQDRMSDLALSEPCKSNDPGMLTNIPIRERQPDLLKLGIVYLLDRDGDSGLIDYLNQREEAFEFVERNLLLTQFESC